MATLHFELVSPERLLMSGEVAQVDLPGTEGDFGVLPGHAPVLSTLRPGVIDVFDEARRQTRIFVRGGFAEVNPAGLTVLAEEAIPLAELSPERLNEAIRNAEDDLADAKDELHRLRAAEMLFRLRELQAAL